jgi:Protein of unknown function (DUF3035)
MRNLLLLAAGALALASCGKSGLADRNAPDEMAISRNAPLVVPQDFALAPPKPGAPRAAGQDAQSAAMEALFGPGAKVPPKSPAEQQLLDKAGAGNTDPAIRSNAGDPKTPTVNKGAFVRELLDAPVATRDAQIAQVAITG